MAASTMREIYLPWGVPVEVGDRWVTLLDCGMEGGRVRVQTEEETQVERESSRRRGRLIDRRPRTPDNRGT